VSAERRYAAFANARIIGDLISCRNSGKGCAPIVYKVELTVNEYADRFMDIRAGNARTSACA
jgi:hypothetical protein